MAPKRGGKFDVEGFLREMREEHREDHSKVVEKLDEVVKTVNAHETRLVVVENSRKTLRWVTGVVLVAFMGGVVSLIFGLIKVGP